MILANLSRAVREQNYYAVVLEFVIVLAGVVIGFQVNAWNEDRQDRVREAVYIERLHAEVLEAEAGRFGLLENVTMRVGHAAAVLEVVFEDRDPSTLPDGACTSLSRLSIFYLEGYALPTLDELFVTGSLTVIRDEALREALTRYRSFAESASSRFDEIQRAPPNLARLYPALIESGPVREGEFLRAGAVACDYAGMRISPEFKADLLNVNSRAGFFLANALAQERARFDAVGAALGRVRAPSRPAEAP